MGWLHQPCRLLDRHLRLRGREPGRLRNLHALLGPAVPALVWIALFSLVLIAINLRTVGDYGRFVYLVRQAQPW